MSLQIYVDRVTCLIESDLLSFRGHVTRDHVLISSCTLCVGSIGCANSGRSKSSLDYISTRRGCDYGSVCI